MSINENSIYNHLSINKEKSNNQIIFLRTEKEEIKKNGGPINSLNEIIYLNNNNNFFGKVQKNKSVNQIYNSSLKKVIIFNIIKIRKNNRINKRINKKHGGNSKDNIRQSITRHFIKFFFGFVNFYIEKKLEHEKLKLGKEIRFKIYYKDKEKIKLKDILNMTVEKLLLFEMIKNNNKNEINNNKIDTSSNKEKLNIIKMIFSLDNFLKKPIIDLFKDIYLKKREEIDLSTYGIKEELPKNLKLYEKLKENYKNNIEKVKIMESVIKTRIINPIHFKLKKKK